MLREGPGAQPLCRSTWPHLLQLKMGGGYDTANVLLGNSLDQTLTPRQKDEGVVSGRREQAR